MLQDRVVITDATAVEIRTLGARPRQDQTSRLWIQVTDARGPGTKEYDPFPDRMSKRRLA